MVSDIVIRVVALDGYSVVTGGDIPVLPVVGDSVEAGVDVATVTVD